LTKGKLTPAHPADPKRSGLTDEAITAVAAEARARRAAKAAEAPPVPDGDAVPALLRVPDFRTPAAPDTGIRRSGRNDGTPARGRDPGDRGTGTPSPGPWANSIRVLPGWPNDPDAPDGSNGPDPDDPGPALPFSVDGGRQAAADRWPAETFVSVRDAQGECAHCGAALRGFAERSAADPQGRLFHPGCALYHVRRREP